LARILDLVVLGGIELDDGATAEAKHLVDRHIGRPEHDLNIEGNLIDRGHSNPCCERKADGRQVNMVW
jgi:hypothetical protein